MSLIRSFPLTGPVDRTLQWAQDNTSVREVLWNILLTAPGERIMRPEFGAGIKQFIHQPNNETTRRLMADLAFKAITRWEPRISLVELTVKTSAQTLNMVTLDILYRIKQTGEENSLQLGLQLQS